MVMRATARTRRWVPLRCWRTKGDAPLIGLRTHRGQLLAPLPAWEAIGAAARGEGCGVVVLDDVI